MKTRSTALAAAHAAPVQRPGVLVSVAFASGVRYWSSRDTVTIGATQWVAQDLRVEGLQVLPFSVSGSIVIGNRDGQAGSLVLADGVQDRAVSIFAFDGAANGVGDPLWLADAVGSSAQVSEREVRITLRHRTEFLTSPRTYVTAQAGFTHLTPAGTVLRINGIDYRLERRP